MHSTFIFSSGLKFNKLDMQFDLEGENSNCDLQSALFLDKDGNLDKTMVLAAGTAGLTYLDAKKLADEFEKDYKKKWQVTN